MDIRTVFKITGMTCASCANTVEKTLASAPGVSEVNLNFATEKATVTYDPSVTSETQLIEVIEGSGYGVMLSEVTLNITGMTCASCVNAVERALQKVQGVLSAGVNLATEKATVRYNPESVTVSDLRKAVADAGYQAALPDTVSADEDQKARDDHIRHLRRLVILAFGLAIPTFVLSLVTPLTETANHWLLFTLATPVEFFIGRQFFTGAYKSLRHRQANMDTLIAVGTAAAYWYSFVVTLSPGSLSGHVYYDTAALIISIILLGRYLEARAKGQTSAAIKKLIGLQAKTANVIIDGAETQIPIEDVEVGHIIAVRPG